jgi:hypothetical protein
MATAVDLKAGFCSACRRGAHVMCQSARCDCDSTRSHPNRPRATTPPAKAAVPAPAAARVATPPPATNGTPKKPETGLAAPIFERVREDPPETVRKPRVSAADQVLPILEDINRVGDDLWWRVGLFPKRQQAGAARSAVIKRLAATAGEWEFKAVKVPPPGPGASALYARRKVADG